MAHLWIHESGAWAVAPLDGRVVALPAGLEPPVQARAAGASSALGPVLLREDRPGLEERWLLLAHPARRARVNGDLLATGLRVLHDRDCINLPGHSPLYFSVERLAQVEPLPPPPRPIACPRCHELIAAGAPAVLCPACRLWHHQDSRHPCWTYDSTCAHCDQPTAFDTGFRWTPEAPR